MLSVFMFEAATETEGTISDSKALDLFNTYIGFIQNAIWVIGILVAIVLIVLSIVNIKRRSYKFTNSQISALKSNGKYIPGIFVELNESKEILRYFLYGKKWKHRIIRKFNYIYNNAYGTILKKGTVEPKLKFHLSLFSSMNDIIKVIDSAIDYHKRFGERKVKLKPEYKESEILFEIVYYPFLNQLEDLKKKAEAAATNYLVLTGSAGNGKTNLLCSISELAMKLNQCVIFLNSRDINTDIGAYILTQLNVHKKLVSCKNLYYKIVNAELWARRKKLFIFVDAVNENENEEFGRNVQAFVNEMNAYRQFKIIASCRNEYYQERYEAAISRDINQDHLVYDLKSSPYPETAVNRLIEQYRRFFHYTGYISDAVKSVICEHLLLLRVFFEVYRDSDTDALSIKKHEIFAEYINHVKKSCTPSIERMLDVIADSMLSSMQFDNIEKTVLNGFSVDEINKAFDETILLNKKLIFFRDTIAERQKEVIYFVFDEIRDYYLARRIMQAHTESVIDGDAIIKHIQEIRDAKVSCEEGIIHYAYVFFRTADSISEEKRKEYCSQILDFYRIKDSHQDYYYHRHHREQFMNYGLNILFTIGLPLLDFEIEYIQDCLRKAPYEDGGKMFDVALKGTKVGLTTDLELYFNILFGLKDKEAIIRAYKTMAAESALANVNLPFDLILIHKNLLDHHPDRAVQVQKAAELFMGMFRIDDPEHEFDLQDYFTELPNHQRIQNEMKMRLLQAIGGQ